MKKWFYRMLLSYLPIFLVIVSVVISISFFAVKDFSQKEAKTANRLFLDYVKQTIEHSLKDIDSTVIKGILTDASINEFFYPTQEINRFVADRQASDEIQSLMNTNPLINSIYFVRNSDHAVLSRTALMPYEEFGDRAFVLSVLSQQKFPENWSVMRMYHEYYDQQPVPVLTLVRKVPVLSGSDGFVVINVGIDLIKKSLDEIYKSNLNILRVYDKENNQILGINGFEDEGNLSKVGTQGLPGIYSDYLGWKFQSGIGSKIVYSVFSIFSYIWVALLLVAVCSGALWIVFVTRRNYKPIERIWGRIQQYNMQKSTELLSKNGKDEFHFIDEALNKLIEQSHEVEKQQEENLNFRRKFFFFELLRDRNAFSTGEWNALLERLELPGQADSWCLVVFEIDKYTGFTEQFSRRDQHLLKFILVNVIKEIADQQNVVVWTEWISNHQVATLYQWPVSNLLSAAEICGMVRKWVEENLDFYVTVGVGNSYKQISDMPQSYEEAIESLKYKSSLGGNRIIEIHQVWAVTSGSETIRHVQSIRSIAQSLRLGKEGWADEMNSFFDDLRKDCYSRDEIASLMNYMIYHMFKEISGFPTETQEIWTKDGLPRMNDLLNNFDTIEDFHSGCLQLFAFILNKVEGQRNLRSNRQLILEVKVYVEQHFENPDLSLVLLGDEFQISSKYVSQLFKEEFGEKFIDYLAKVRVGKAKTWLVVTDMPIQEIAVKVGYLHPFSFIRLFKKIVGMTPGDYRKEFRQHQN